MVAMDTSTTATWPWMKDGTVTATTTPANPPAHAMDDRPAVVDVIAAHRARIDQVAAALATDPLYQPNKHDDLWIVRFLLSHKNVKPAIKAAQSTLQFRAQYKLDETDIRYSPPSPNVQHCESLQKFYDYCKPDTFQIVVPDAKLGVVCFFSIGGIDQHGLVKNVDESHWLPTIMYVAEFSHQWCDYHSRTTGRLTSSVRVIDASDLTLSGLSMENSKRDSRAMKVTEDCYPQMLQSILVVRAPAWIQVPWRVVRPFFPRRVVEKIDFLTLDANARDRNRLLKYISLENLPVRYGGKNETWPLDFPLPGKVEKDE
jgi:CRAL/TRIO domain